MKGGIDAADLIRRWPWAYHVTFAANLASIVEWRRLDSASRLMRGAGCVGERKRRLADRCLPLGEHQVTLRNQSALDPTALALPESECLDEYLTFLNRRVYFWPGTSRGPVADGLRMLDKHRARAVLIRVPTRSLVEHNARTPISVSNCNTGASWLARGRKTSRTREHVQFLPQFRGDLDEVVELSYEDCALLPPTSDCADHLAGPWRPLW